MVIVGGGFGGLACARALNRKPVSVLLLDRHNYHLFTPLLYQVATSLLNPSDIAYPFRAIFRRSPNVRFRQAGVVGVDLDRKTIRTHDEQEFPFDSLVLATGSENNYFSNEDLAGHTLGMKTLAESLRLRNHVLSCLELASRAGSGEERRAWLTFVIAGGGPTGVEYAGALAELLQMVLGRDYPELEPGFSRTVLVEGQDRLLGAFHPKLGAYALKFLGNKGVDVRTATLVQEHHDVYVIGDAASVAEDSGELPMLSPPAMQAGRHVAEAILERARGTDGKNSKAFRYVDKGTMATIGRRAAVADVHGLKLKGTLGWLAWLVVHIYYLIGFRNRAVVLGSWGWDYLRRDRPIRLILRSDEDPVSSSLESEPEDPR